MSVQPPNSTRNTPAADSAEQTDRLAESFEQIVGLLLKSEGAVRAPQIILRLVERLRADGVALPALVSTPYVNTIPAAAQPSYPGNRDLERRIKSYVRWNAMAMVVNANRDHSGIGGHISTYASAATLYEVGFNHFFRGNDGGRIADMVYFQGHASPGVYARAFLEGRLTEQQLHHFRQELSDGGGLSSYPHPYL
ncbi:pyruvate dehydrogenase (acetyl-transferring), homodimeric type, partial [bacterium]|nr:pyruvate dehydrogenase (acetyl-transferring), homodimeric type [bacterium]